jgi:hypothetical protein
MSDQSQNKQQGFVELNRRFRKLDQKGKAEEAAFESYTMILFGREGGLGWAKTPVMMSMPFGGTKKSPPKKP